MIAMAELCAQSDLLSELSYASKARSNAHQRIKTKSIGE
jgi:hypothetical protein